ncbi:MotA/TolQ/ExbB proton channel family protein [Flavivirga amylovorans]|uniref:MotA/TolQ/ExbB proton channel family protein n=1 Tax=Flavivirga amylovorans TaxID=870486 RepID=A0ABT8WYQ5_9FLAO|nr:MotA/TolQ/ExbB proton channel family protein [Flavivirga amylovorans]MDO5986632.1 MotA/TolQ/ExbB proton channel family protein [Flavivirga amylovorans]
MRTLYILQGRSFFSELVKRFYEGGPLFMSLILICLLVAIFFLIRGFLSLNKDGGVSKKMSALASDASLLGLVLGFLGSMIGLITAFDIVEATDIISTPRLAGGLKVSFLTTVFGSITFVLIRIGIIILKIFQKS